MRKMRILAAIAAVFVLSAPVCAQDVLSGSLIVSRSDGSDAAPRVLFRGVYGERYAALPGRQYLILPPEDSTLPQPLVEKTSAGTYRYRYSAAGELDGLGKTVAGLVASFETPGGKQSVAVETEEGTATVYGEYDRDEAKRLFVLLNEQRKQAGLPGLSWDASLAEAARLRAAEMALNHSSKRPNGTDYSTAGKKIAGENFLYGYETADIAAARMMELPGRKENILRDKFVTVGTAAFESDQCAYWVMEFGRE